MTTLSAAIVDRVIFFAKKFNFLKEKGCIARLPVV
nr:MAG TPA: hypothetical protein [Caudoviricetes sp.]